MQCTRRSSVLECPEPIPNHNLTEDVMDYVVIALIGIGFSALAWLFLGDDLRTHYHECPNCRFVWSHRTVWAQWHKNSHTCEKCGTKQYTGYFKCRFW